MRRILTIYIALIAVAVAAVVDLSAATIIPEQSSYAYPMEGIARLYSANFGEMRAGHFHSGVDIKSDGAEGKRIVSAADGYISRLSISPFGYGVSLYVTHPSNGTTTQYGHLSKFRDDIEEYAQAERYRLQQSSINIFLTESQFPVKRGELIAYSGNTGSSSGPHLHYEIRESRTQRPLNPVTMGAIQPVDNFRPIFTRLYYVECEIKDGVMLQSVMSEYELEQQESGSYRVVGNKTVEVGREGYFVVAVYDRKDNVRNKFGIYSVEMKKGDQTIYRHQQDGFLFSETRYCNSVSYYPLQRKTSIPHYRLYKQEGLPESMLHTIKDDGLLRTVAGEQHKISIVACDDMKNISTLQLKVRGRSDESCIEPTVNDSQKIAKAMAATSYSGDGVELKLPSGVLYESIPYQVSQSDSVAIFKAEMSGCKAYSRIYDIFDYNTPLHRAMEIFIEAEIPQEQIPQAVMVCIDEKGGYGAIKGEYKDGRYIALSRSAGRFFVATDLEAPTIQTALQDGADLSARSFVSFEMKDNLSGVNIYEATIDGEWIALELKGSRVTHHFRSPADGEEHTIELRVEDLAGNESILSRRFVR